MCAGAASITNIKGLWSFLSEQVEDLLSVGDSVGNSKIFVPAAQLCTDVIQSNTFVAVSLQEEEEKKVSEWKTCRKFILPSRAPERHGSVTVGK